MPFLSLSLSLSGIYKRNRFYHQTYTLTLNKFNLQLAET